MTSTLNFLWCAVCLRERRPQLGEAPSTQGRESAVTVLDGQALCAEHLAVVLDASGLLANRIESQPKTMLTVDTPSTGPVEVKGWRTTESENDRIETAAAALVDHLDGVVSNPWDDPGFRAAINELSAALSRQPVGLDG